MARKKTSNTNKKSFNGYLQKLETEIGSNPSKVSLILGVLIVLVIGILVFNYFNRNKAALGPAQQTEINQQQDVAPDKLPGKYTVKNDDTLFTIAENYYKDGSKFTEIAKTNNLTNADQIETGQVLEIPKLEAPQTGQLSPQPTSTEVTAASGTGGGNTTIWGPRIEGSSYTVVEGDWLSTIAGRAFGDITAFDRIAKANNIQNPDHIEPGMVLNLPR